MIVLSYSNIDIIQGVIGYGNAVEGITDWRITNTSNGIFNILNSSSIIRPSGGTTEIGEIPGSTDRYMIFTAGTSTFTVPSGGIKCDILMVGGGGGGGFDGSGGGGGGEVKYYTNNITTFKTGTSYTLSEGTYTVNVGTGGAAGVNVSSAGTNGTISEIKNNLGTTLLSAGGGGGGGSRNTNGVSGVGGGGGAGHGASYTGGSSTGSGGIGGNSSSTYTGGGGAGGANVANKNGGNGSSTIAGTGGVGANIDITGILAGYGGGGGGGTHLTATRIIGTQGGGNGGTYNDMPTSGTSNTGGGGGGGGNAGAPNSSGTGGNGGSGIVIIRYSTANISIIDNGNTGIGTTPTINSSLLEIAGDINISGNYKINNVDIINSSSNYVLSTSNLLVSRISTGIRDTSNYVSSINTTLNTLINDTSNYMRTTSNILANSFSGQWTSASSGIYYNTPISTPITLPNEIGVEKYMIFTYTGDTISGSGQTQYTINIPTGGIVCDILVVGGGGGGDQINAGGGGGGTVLYATNVTIPSNTYTIRVGKGGLQNVNGNSSEAFGAICLGGGSTSYVAWNTPNNGTAGGSGSGGSPGSWSQSTTGVGGGVGVSTKGILLNSGILYNGNIGGNGLPQTQATGAVCGGGGGGAGSVGLNSSQTQYTTRSSWITAGKPSNGGDGIQINITGTNYYWGAGGGGGGTATHVGDGGLGGGGGGGVTGTSSTAGLAGIGGINNGINGNIGGTFMSNGGDGAPNSGSGGGGGGDGGNGGTGGSGIIIIKYNTIQQTIPKSIISLPVITPTIITGITTGTIGTTDSYMMFAYTIDNIGSGQTQYTINTRENLICDILVVGGGGAGGTYIGGGGGAGGVLYIQNTTIPIGTYNISVGNGGTGFSGAGASTTTQNGKSSKAFGIEVFGGGYGGAGGWGISGTGPGQAGGSGGSGGAGGSCHSTSPGGAGVGGSITLPNLTNSVISINTYNYYSGSGATSMIFNGNAAGSVGANGGGGAGGNAPANTDQANAGAGADGIAINITGTSYIWGGGGGGGQNAGGKAGNGGKGGGGGGNGSQSTEAVGIGGIGGITFGQDGDLEGDGTPTGGNGGAGTGGGGGGTGRTTGSPNAISGSGGSGIVIIRYRKNTITAYVGIGTTNPVSELHLYDDTNNNTKLTIQNNYTDPVVITPNTGYTSVETLESNIYYRTLTFTYSPNYPENPANTTLLAWYRFDGDGLDYNPWTTKYNLINSGATYSSGTTSDSFFQGRRYIIMNTGGMYVTTLAMANRAFSIAVWIRTTTTDGAFFITQGWHGTNTYLHIGSRGNNAYSLAFYANDLECGVGVSGNPTSYPGDVNNWVHLVYVVLPNYNRRIYRNGVLIATDANGSAFSGSGNFNLGGSIHISDLRIYTNGLSSTEVEQLYNSYTNSLITDNYGINFPNTTSLLVNGTSKTVKGQYNISTGHINSSMLPLEGQSDIPLASTATTTVTIKYPYNTFLPTLPTLITVSGATSTIIGTTDRCISFTYTSDSTGLTGQTLYTFTPVQNIICDILIVGGGGGGGRFGGGGGGGAVLLGVNFKLNAGNLVSIKVGNGGTGATTVNNGVNGINGYDSSITINSVEYIAKGGGGGGTRNNSPYVGKNGNDGGSGGGGSTGDSGQGLGGVSNKNNYANFQSFGNNGGNGKPNTSGNIGWASGGGGGAGSKGSDFTSTNGGGNGGLGKEFIALFGASVGHNGYFAGGGGGNTYYNVGNRGYGNGGLGLYGGGGNGAFDGTIAYFADNGLPNTGGGGGGGNHNTYTNYSSSGGNGGSGFVIIRYRINTIQTSSVELIKNTAPPNEILVAGTTSTTIGQFDRLISFPYTSDSTGLVGQTQYTFTTTENLICDILIVAGGGGGGMNSGGGGGAGGLILLQNINLFGTYTIKIGRGGAGGTQIATNTVAENGINTSFETYIAIGGGAGVNSGGANGNPGGSGGGAANDMTGNRVGGAGTAGQGNKGGDGTIPGGGDRTGGGGGGAGEAGQTSVSTSQGGKGGIGRDMSLYFGTIFGVNGWFAGGGGGGGGQGTGGIGGTGGGGNGGINNQEGINGTGGGGGGAHGNQSTLGKKGGSGIVIIRYRRNTGYKIGNYNGDFKIISSSTAGDTDYMRITADGASIYNPTGSPLWSTVSDRRIKENIEKASYDKCYDNINKLELYRFNYIKELNNINKDNKQLGYIAQEVEDIFPKAVSSQVFYNNSLSISDLLSIDISQINYSLYGAIKKLIEIYNNVDKRIDALEKILNIEEELVIDISTTNNISFYTPPETNIVVDTLTTSNIIGILSVSTMSIYTSNNIIYDISTSNNIDFYTPSTYNYSIDTIKVNNIIDTSITSNLILNIPDTLSTSNIVI